MGIDLAGWKARIRTAVDEVGGQLLATSHEIHANPELLLEEQAKADFERQLEAGEMAGRQTWLTRGREYTGAGTAAE